RPVGERRLPNGNVTSKVDCGRLGKLAFADNPRLRRASRCGSIASRSLRMVVLAGSQAMVANFRSLAPALAWILTLGLAGLVSAQPPAPTADRPHLAKDAKEAMDFLGTWARVTSGEDNFKGATYVGSESCKGGGCHDQQLAEWRTTWHSKILTLPSTETVTGNFNNAVIPFHDVAPVAT